MRRRIPASFAAVLLAVATALSVSSTAAVATGSCGDSWGNDGHAGPWYVGSNQSLHGNTLVIGGANCSASTQWDVTYWVFKEGFQGQLYSPIMEVRRGNGPTSWSISTNPVGCNQGWIYYTQVFNGVTGNYIRKPPNGLVIC